MSTPGGLSWADWREAVLLVAQAEADRTPCGACGGPTKAEMIDVSSFNQPAFVAGHHRCVNQCFKSRPADYLKATRPQQAAYRGSMQSKVDEIVASMTPAKRKRWRR